MPNRNRGVPCPIGLPRGAEALGTATTVMRRAALLPIRRRDRQDKLSRKIIAHAVDEKLAAEQLQDRFARAQADVVALHARKLLARAVGKADVQPSVFALGQNGQVRGGVGVFFHVRQEVIRHALEHLHVGRDGAGRRQRHEVDIKAPAAQLGRALAEQLRTLDKRRLHERIGRLSPEYMACVERALAVELGL